MTEGEMTGEGFFTPEGFAKDQMGKMESPRGPLMVASCRSGSQLANRTVQRYREFLTEAGSEGGLPFLDGVDYQFANSETCVRLDEHVSGCDVYLFQALCDPIGEGSVDQNYMALLIAARALRENGANHVTAILPYLAYGRQDKPTEFMREATTARLMADLVAEAGVDRLVAWHPHCGQIRGFYGSMPVHMLEPLTLFIDEFERSRGREDTIVVAPDAGASKLVTHFGRALEVECAIGSKHRPRPDESEISQIIGDFAGKRTAIVLDDEISTGGTIFNLVNKLIDEYDLEEIYLAVSHNRCVEQGRERLQRLHEGFGMRKVVVTNSISQTDEFTELPFVAVRCLSDTLARTINRIHYDRSVSEVFYRPVG